MYYPLLKTCHAFYGIASFCSTSNWLPVFASQQNVTENDWREFMARHMHTMSFDDINCTQSKRISLKKNRSRWGD